MTTEEKKATITRRVSELMRIFDEVLLEDVDKVLNSGAVDIENYDPDTNFLVLPQTILTALLKNYSEYFSGKGTSFEKQMKKDVKNIRMFI